MKGIVSLLGRPQVAFAVIEQSDTIYASVLAANTAEHVSIPSGANFVLFSADGDFYAKLKSAEEDIAVPTTEIADGSSPILNPMMLVCKGHTKINLVAGAATTITMSFYS